MTNCAKPRAVARSSLSRNPHWASSFTAHASNPGREEACALRVAEASTGQRGRDAQQQRYVVVHVVAVPHGHAEGGVESKRFPGSPQGLESLDRFGVVPPPRAPAVLAADRSGVDRCEVLDHPGLDVGEGEISPVLTWFCCARRRPYHGLKHLDSCFEPTQPRLPLRRLCERREWSFVVMSALPSHLRASPNRSCSSAGPPRSVNRSPKAARAPSASTQVRSRCSEGGARSRARSSTAGDRPCRARGRCSAGGRVSAAP